MSNRAFQDNVSLVLQGRLMILLRIKYTNANNKIPEKFSRSPLLLSNSQREMKGHSY